MTEQQDWRAALGALIDPADLPAEEAATEPQPAAEQRQTGRLNVFVERKGRGGKVATIITGFTVSDEAVAEIASRLKRKLGVGGSARGGEILIQGDRSEAVRQSLKDMNLKV